MERLCPVCAGLVGPGVQWCGQCFADLRAPVPAPEPPSPEVPPAPSVAAPALTPRPGGAPHPEVPPAAEATGPPALLVLPLVDPPAPVGAVQPGWPCTACSSVVPYEADTCPVCGAGFLAALTGSGVPRLPVVGTPGDAGRRGTWLVAAVVFGALLLLLLLALGLAGRAAG